MYIYMQTCKYDCMTHHHCYSIAYNTAYLLIGQDSV